MYAQPLARRRSFCRLERSSTPRLRQVSLHGFCTSDASFGGGQSFPLWQATTTDTSVSALLFLPFIKLTSAILILLNFNVFHAYMLFLN